MKNLLRSFILLLISLGPFSVFAGPMTELTTSESVAAYIQKTGFNGVLLVGRHKNVLFKKAFGYKNLESQIPLTVDDRFQIGSNTKQFVAAALLKLQEEQKLSIDDPVVKYLPQYKIPGEITIRDILNHTSGIINFTDKDEFWGNLDPEKTLTLDDLIEFALRFPLDFIPKSQWNYSNSGYIIAGKIIEEVSGESWDRFIKRKFLDPLQMTNTGYAERFETVSDVFGHRKNEDKLLPISSFNLSWALSAGALYSTIDDVYKWTSIYSDSSLLNAESRADMQRPFKENYGLGLMIRPYGEDTQIFHTGRTPGFVSKISWLKKADLSVIQLDNIDGSVGGISDLLMNFYSQGRTLVVKLERVSLPVEKLQDYVGRYVAGKFELNVFIKDDKLFLQPNDGQPPYELQCNDTDSFNLGGFAGEEFVRNADGQISGLKHYQNGQVSEFNRQ
jgi:CubicO group peptidase (beta-lactamase class C family)